MEKQELKKGKHHILYEKDFDALFEALHSLGYQVIGPTVEDQTIVYDTITSSQQLPIAWTDVQEAGEYRLQRHDDNTYFAFNVGPISWKRFLHEPELSLWKAKYNGAGLAFTEEDKDPPKQAFLGVKACETAAILKQDNIFLKNKYVDTYYKKRRDNTFIITTNCTKSVSTCFCTSMDTGPYAESGFDLALTEVLKANEHYFLVEIGSDAGKKVAGAITSLKDATVEDYAEVRQIMDRVSKNISKKLDTKNISEFLTEVYEHPHWDEVGQRCLNCANCTMVCPTCFCTTVDDVTDLTGSEAERIRRWDSCFTMDFSYIHGGSIRPGNATRYRHWLTHKLGTWHNQFGESGCVGCGRCITWCPVGIDITEEVKALHNGTYKKRKKQGAK